QGNHWIEKTQCSLTPIEGRTIYTDAGKRSKTAACVWKEGGHWRTHLLQGDSQDSSQTLELAAVLWVFNQWDREPINVVSDSLYVVGVVQRLEDALLRRAQNPRLGQLFQ
ncbi:PO113 protein, partial [Bucorvus abyssinicus]|nr:PO113 protein [Bucorvus abyssinicus]